MDLWIYVHRMYVGWIVIPIGERWYSLQSELLGTVFFNVCLDLFYPHYVNVDVLFCCALRVADHIWFLVELSSHSTWFTVYKILDVVQSGRPLMGTLKVQLLYLFINFLFSRIYKFHFLSDCVGCGHSSVVSASFTVQTPPSVTNQDNNPPHVLSMHIIAQDHTPDNNFSLLTFFSYRCFTTYPQFNQNITF